MNGRKALRRGEKWWDDGALREGIAWWNQVKKRLRRLDYSRSSLG
jgi:hypothetical protein